jgi:hypothetical protein
VGRFRFILSAEMTSPLQFRARVSCLVKARQWIALPIALSIVATVGVSTNGPRFYDDDPIAREPESKDASDAKPDEIGLLFELSYNLFVTANHTPSNTRAGNLNTIDEVPESSWFSNRIGSAAISAADVARGPVIGSAPAPERWVIIREKSAGAHPGFTAKDANGETWFLSFDPPSHPEGATGANVVASKIFWALGYNQIEIFVSTFDPDRVVIDPEATKRRPSGKRTPFTRDDLDEVLERAARNADGSYRVAAGRQLTGKVLGGFRYAGTRPDDPNDIVPHEHRRELRALRVFGAWTNLTDLKAGNTLDTLVSENGHTTVKHVLQDVGSTFGMANRPHEWDIGWEYFYEPWASRRRLMSFGFLLSPWQTVPYTEYPSIGRFEGDQFDPTTWKPQTPITPFMEMRADDAFWAARRVMAFTDELIRSAVQTGEYSDPAAAHHLSSVLIKRRDAIGRAYLTAVNPVVNPRLDGNGSLTFENAAVDADFAQAPAAYRATWSRFDNATGATTPIAETRGTTTAMAAPGNLPVAAGSFVQVDISAEGTDHRAWQEPVRLHFRRTGDGWKLVGLQRLPDTVKATTLTTRATKDSR